MKLEIYPDKQVQAERLARAVVIALSNTIEAKGRAVLAVPGGTTPGPFLEALSREKLAWDRVTVLPTDERCVAEMHDRSNAKLIRAAFLQNDSATSHYLSLTPLDNEAPDVAARRLSKAVAEVAPVDVVVLGMGADMHTASLFPGADGLEAALASGADPVMAITAPGAPEPRLTLSAPVLQTATHIHLLITGAEKRAALELAQALPVTDAPVRAILDAPAGVTVHYTD